MVVYSFVFRSVTPQNFKSTLPIGSLQFFFGCSLALTSQNFRQGLVPGIALEDQVRGRVREREKEVRERQEIEREREKERGQGEQGRGTEGSTKTQIHKKHVFIHTHTGPPVDGYHAKPPSGPGW